MPSREKLRLCKNCEILNRFGDRGHAEMYHLSSLGVWTSGKTSSSLTPTEWCGERNSRSIGQAKSKCWFSKIAAAILLIYNVRIAAGHWGQCVSYVIVSLTFCFIMQVFRGATLPIIVLQGESPELLPRLWGLTDPHNSLHGNRELANLKESNWVLLFPWGKEWEEWIWILLEINNGYQTPYWNEFWRWNLIFLVG